jgi:hypothetical protein
MPAGAVKLSIKPVFVGWIKLLSQVPLQLLVIVRDIPDPDATFGKIRQLIDAQNG